MSAARMDPPYARTRERTHTFFANAHATSCALARIVFVRGDVDETAAASGDAGGQIDGALAAPVGDEARDLLRLRAGQRNAELAAHDVADDAIAQRRRVRGERGDRHRDARLRRLDDVLDDLVDHVGERLVVFAQLIG